MKLKTVLTLAGVASIASATAQGLYQAGQESGDSMPITWQVGANMIWDDNVFPVQGSDDKAWSINPYVQANFTNVDPRTTMDFYTRLGVNYYLETLDAVNPIDGSPESADEVVPSMRLGFNLNHSANERLKFISQNFVAYEMEPEFAYGVSNDRTSDPYFMYNSDNSVGYRWSARVGSYTGLGFNGLLTDGGDRRSVIAYHQMRYQFDQRTVFTGQYRHTSWTGDASDSTNHFISGGVEHRLSQTSIFLGNAGVQLRSVDNGGDNTSPYVEGSVSTRLTSSFGVKAFTRYSMEDFNTIQQIDGTLYEYSDLKVLRVGLTGDYRISPRVTGFGGLDVVHSSFEDGKEVNGDAVDSGRTENMLNGYIGLRAQLTDDMMGNCTINYTKSISDYSNNDYDRLRLSAGVSYAF